MKKRIFLITVFALLALAGCDNDEDTLKYRQPFLGQWQEIARGNDHHPELEPDGHILEFLPDGTHRYLHNDGTVGSARSYRADAKFLYYGSGKDPDGHTYRYTFIGTDTLLLDYVDGAITKSTDTPTFYIYVRPPSEEPSGEEEPEQEPISDYPALREPFIGQWREIARGNDAYPNGVPDGSELIGLVPNGHVIEFLPDGIYLARGGEFKREYRVDAELLYLGSGTCPDGHAYRYTFTGTDTLRLDYADGIITDRADTPLFHIYKRLKSQE